MTPLPTPRRRLGYTLIEMLLVIAIIAILVSLLMVGINYARVRANKAGASSDISQLNAALQQFKAKYNIYPPDRFILYSRLSDYQLDIAANGPNSLAAKSLAVINRLWPSIGAFGSTPVGGTNPPLPWKDGVNAYPPPAGNTPVGEILEGDQCLVFFLAGIPTPAPNLYFNGFAANPKDPATVGGTNAAATRIKFFEFPPDRMINPRDGTFPPGNPNAATNATTTFLSFKDYFGQQPYLYFSANNVKNGYNLFYPVNVQYTITMNDYAGGGAGTVQAYYKQIWQVSVGTQTKRGEYWSPETCQIICAGADGRFGTNTGAWTPATAEVVFPASTSGADDQVNFYDAELGVTR
jgi:prepilin-type N-terminal cleavage/methylation domain-containing protein